MTIQTDIMKRVTDNGRGKWVFTPRDFFDIGSRPAVNQALARLVKSGEIRRINRGFYDLPRYNEILKRVQVPSLDQGIAAIVRRDCIKIMDCGMSAANLLGLTTAVSAKPVYDTDGTSRVVVFSGWNIEFRHAPPKVMRWHGRPSAHVAQAVRWLGPRLGKDDRIPGQLNRVLPDDVKADLFDHAADLPGWAQWVPQAMRDIADKRENVR